MAFGEGACGVCVQDVTHLHGGMLLCVDVSPCCGEERPERAINSPGGGSSILLHTSVSLNFISGGSRETWDNMGAAAAAETDYYSFVCMKTAG